MYIFNNLDLFIILNLTYSFDVIFGLPPRNSKLTLIGDLIIECENDVIIL